MFKEISPGVPLPTTYTKFVLELKIGKNENMANNAIIPHKTLSPLMNLTLIINFLPLL